MLGRCATIGDGAVIGLGAVLSGSVPGGAVRVGNPARIDKERVMGVLEQMLSAEAYYLKITRELGLRQELGISNSNRRLNGAGAEEGERNG